MFRLQLQARLLRLGFCQNRYRQLVSEHIMKITDSKPVFQECINDFKKITREGEESKRADHLIKTHLNLIFNVHSLPSILDRHKDQLRSMVLHGTIPNQFQLDKITTWLLKQLKQNKDVQIDQFLALLRQTQQQEDSLDQQIRHIWQQNHTLDVAELSKRMRNKYLSLDSQLIYQKCIEAAKQIQRPQIDKKAGPSSNQFWDKIANIKPRLLGEECNDPEITAAHYRITHGILRFRFPPEPNGYLHIGHIKAMRINFETAKRVGGTCYLRYDDTNPETESHEYIDNILSNVRWLGYEPDKITFASDYFPEMLEFAIQLVKEGHAYVCQSSQAQIEEERRNKRPNPFRVRSVEESLRHFPDLSEGQTLRLKLEPDAKNPTLRDPIIYRRKDKAHPRSGCQYKVYPMYDFAHCIGDSLQHIDYSLCSLEFEVRRELYYKILHLLRLYKPIVWEYSRLNIEGSVISKRKIKALLDQGVIKGWDDPRLLTIGGLVKRGYTPSMLFKFIDKMNSSRSGNENVVQYSLLEREMRKDLMGRAQKQMMVIEPMRLKIHHYEQLAEKECAMGTVTLNVAESVFIERSQQLDEGQIIILKYIGAFQIIQTSPPHSHALCRKIPQTVDQLKKQGVAFKVLHWVSQTDASPVEVVTFEKLLDASGSPVPASRKVFRESLVHRCVTGGGQEEAKYWQMERLGFFKFDEGRLIRCVGL